LIEDARFALRAALFSLTSTWRLEGEGGERLVSRRLATRLKTHIEVKRRGAAGDAVVLSVRATRWSRMAARFEVRGEGDEAIGALERDWVGSLGRDRWRLLDGDGDGAVVGEMLEAGSPFLARAIPYWPRRYEVVADGRTIATLAASWWPSHAALWLAADAAPRSRGLALAACLVAAHTESHA
jgi:hypothetical protein